MQEDSEEEERHPGLGSKHRDPLEVRYIPITACLQPMLYYFALEVSLYSDTLLIQDSFSI